MKVSVCESWFINKVQMFIRDYNSAPWGRYGRAYEQVKTRNKICNSNHFSVHFLNVGIVRHLFFFFLVVFLLIIMSAMSFVHTTIENWFCDW